jgi:hypothetical protein
MRLVTAASTYGLVMASPSVGCDMQGAGGGGRNRSGLHPRQSDVRQGRPQGCPAVTNRERWRDADTVRLGKSVSYAHSSSLSSEELVQDKGGGTVPQNHLS